jgi:hypothetical protein
VTVGETLTEARNQAGLSVDELSERTRIRGTVIRSIEEDDYAACGGDLYVRGYVRAIAGAVGIDAQPLIREYDQRQSGGPNERANGSTGRHALGYPTTTAPRDAAPTSFDLPAIPEAPPTRDEPAPAEDLNATRFDMPAVAADPATTSFDLPRVPEVAPTTAFLAAEIPAADTPAAGISVAEPPTTELPVQVTPAMSAPPAAVPPGNADTRYDLPPVPADPTQVSPQDFVGAVYAAPVDVAAGTQVIPAVDFDPTPAEATAAWTAADPTTAWPAAEGAATRPAPAPGDPGQAGPPPTGTAPGGGARNKRRRGIFAVAAGLVVLAAAGFGIHLATGNTSTTNTAAAAPSTNAAAEASASAKASESAAAQARASAAAQASQSAAAKASASAAAKAKASAAAQRVVSLPVASAMAFGPSGFADGDDASDAGNVIAANSSHPWTTQWYTTADFGMLKHGTGILLDLGSQVTVTKVTLDLSQFQGADLQLRIGNSAALQNLTVAATANNVSGTTNLTLPHPVAARYLLVWITQLPPDGAGHYSETISHVAVTGHR